jgi:hypothetical protein
MLVGGAAAAPPPAAAAEEEDEFNFDDVEGLGAVGGGPGAAGGALDLDDDWGLDGEDDV